MARFIKTISADGSSSGGGGAGVTLDQVCTAVCNVICNNVTRNENGITEAQDFSEDGNYKNRTNQIIPGFGCWEIICNCPYWDTCYGCCVTWCVDTMKYRAFRIVYTGIRNQVCCHFYPCLGFGTDSCFCVCSQAYRGRYQMCGWPMMSCCCWYAYNQEHILHDYCVQCMNAEGRDSVWGFEFMVCAPTWKRPTSQHYGRGVWYETKMAQKYYCECSAYCYSDWSVHKGTQFCGCLFWNCNQNSNQHLTRLCWKSSNQPLMSALYTGSYTASNVDGGSCSTGVPCWTIWGQPCVRPMFGTCNMGS